MEEYIIKEETLTDIADAIRAKIGSSEQMTPFEMAKNIRRITGDGAGVDVSGVTATAEDVLNPKVFVDSEGNEIIGTMPVVELGQPSLNIDSQGVITSNIIQEQGFVFSGNKSTTKQLMIQTAKNITPSSESQIAVTSGLYTTGDIIVNAIPDDYTQLNFEIVGNTIQPTNPKENTIWVNTDIEIINWEFSAMEPAGAEGLVWIPTGLSSLMSFNALKKNGVTVYPIGCAQFISGVWINKSAAIYQAGMWSNFWNGKLYDVGDEYEQITGGFIEAYRNNIGTRTFTKNKDNFYFRSVGTSNGGAHIYASTEKKIDLSSFSTLYARIKHSPSSSTSFYLAAHDRTDEPLYNVPCVLKQSSSKEGVVSLDISELSGEHYILFGLGGNVSNNSGSCYVYEVYLT